MNVPTWRSRCNQCARVRTVGVCRRCIVTDAVRDLKALHFELQKFYRQKLVSPRDSSFLKQLRRLQYHKSRVDKLGGWRWVRILNATSVRTMDGMWRVVKKWEYLWRVVKNGSICSAKLDQFQRCEKTSQKSPRLLKNCFEHKIIMSLSGVTYTMSGIKMFQEQNANNSALDWKV